MKATGLTPSVGGDVSGARAGAPTQTPGVVRLASCARLGHPGWCARRHAAQLRHPGWCARLRHPAWCAGSDAWRAALAVGALDGIAAGRTAFEADAASTVPRLGR